MAHINFDEEEFDDIEDFESESEIEEDLSAFNEKYDD